MTLGANLEAEVVPTSESSAGERSHLLLRCGASTSPLLSLPAPVSPGVKEVKVVGQFYEIKLAVSSTPPTPFDAPTGILDATQLLSAPPTSFVCAACSLPLIQASKLHEYRDLPSEHWAELVDAWMCHSDQRLHEHVKKHSAQGFWPREGEALVGGSYILFEESAVVQSNFWPANEEDHKVRQISTGASAVGYVRVCSGPRAHGRWCVCEWVGVGRKEGRRWLRYQRPSLSSPERTVARLEAHYGSGVLPCAAMVVPGDGRSIPPSADTKRPRWTVACADPPPPVTCSTTLVWPRTPLRELHARAHLSFRPLMIFLPCVFYLL